MAGSDKDAPDDSAQDSGSTTIAGFQLIKRVGRGGMGNVYRARQLSVDRIVAVKVLRPDLARNTSFIGRFKEEARSAARLNHPNIVQAIDSGEEGGYYYFAMEYVDGETLHRLMLREGVLDEKRALKIALDVTRALEHAMTQGIVHRDIKPGNIMLSRDGVTKLCDLGLARARDEEEGTSLGAAVGTPYYISPEQAMGRMDVDGRSDIYSLGATLFRAVVGQPAFNAPTKAEILEKHVHSPLPWPADHNPALSDGICYLIAKMMAKKPEERYQTPSELAEDIERVQRGEAPKSAVVELEVPPMRLSAEERKATAMTDVRLRKKRRTIRQLVDVREAMDRVSVEQSVPSHAVVRLLRGNLDEAKAETFLKYGVLLLSERRFQPARREFHLAAQLGADVSAYMAKLDALGAPQGAVYVPGGPFVSGPPDAAAGKELPAFYIDVNLVTNRKYHDFMRATGAPPPGHWISRDLPEGQEEHPVVNVTWDEARAYAQWTGKRLPTADEWEKAARGTDGRAYPWGNNFDPLCCNTSEAGIGETTVAGRFARGISPYGCHDMFGNVLQWCEDAAALSPEDPEGRVVRGVSFEMAGAEAGCWRREIRKRSRRSRKCGFRCALDV
jgi:serine/threonine-protein kinase